MQKLQVEKEKIETTKKALEEKGDQKASLEKCIDDVMKLYVYDWNGNCKLRKLGDECTLDPDIAIMINNRRDNLKQECFEKYPQK
ncbi:MAG: hypothetical protein ABIO02_02065 [Patescibacteria group bacterium]